MELHELTALQLRDALARREASAREAAAHFLDRIGALNPALGSFTAVTAEAALAAAGAADRALASGAAPGPLHGLPLAYKDLWDVAGVPTTYGSAAVPHEAAAGDHPLVARLRAAGSVSLGKTQIPEFGLNCYSENLIAPPARNPLDPRRTAGGSSGGSAAAVAAGMLPFAPGNDGGGSVRIPASACGLIGLKPGFGTVPTDLDNGREDAFGAPRLVASGPLARTAADAGLLLDAMAPPPARPAAGAPASYLEAALRAEPSGGRPLRIGLSTRSPFEAEMEIVPDREARAALADGVAALERAGHRVEDADVRYDNRYPEAFSIVWTSALADAPIPADGLPRLTRLTRTFLERSLRRPESRRRWASETIRKIAEDCRAQWGRWDLVLTPAMAQLPPPVGHFTAHAADDDYRLQCQYTPYTSMVNVAGLPAVTVPTATSGDGLSMGVQLIGRAGSEADLLAVAAQIHLA